MKIENITAEEKRELYNSLSQVIEAVEKAYKGVARKRWRDSEKAMQRVTYAGRLEILKRLFEAVNATPVVPL